MSKYVAKRKDVCAGSLLMPQAATIKVYDEKNNEITEHMFEDSEFPKVSVSCNLICRGMLFDVNENGLSNDLIYTTPTNYTIKGIEPKIDTKSDFIISNYVELEELLKYLKYGVDLTQKDLNQIYRKLIIHNWWLQHHSELFGFRKIYDQTSGEFMGYMNGGIQTIPMNIYEKLSSISCTKNGRPYKEEPGYSLIRRRK